MDLNKLIDKIATIHANNELRHIKWEECNSRQQEAKGEATEKYFKTDANGVFKEILQKVADPADTSTEMLLSFALKRRGVAFEVGGLMSFSSHDKLVSYFITAMNEEPVTGYLKVTISQVHEADIEVFRYMAAQTEEGIAVAVGNKFPLDELLDKAMLTTRFTQIMACKQKGGSGGSASSGTKRGMQDDDWAKMKSELNQLKQNIAKGNSKGGKNSKGSKKQEPNAKSRKKDKSIKMPKELVGKGEPVIDGERVGFRYNIEGCKHAGKRCDKGVHRCIVCRAWDHGASSSRCPMRK